MLYQGMKPPKFIMEDGNIIIGRADFHRDLAWDTTKVQGGGWWKREDDTFIFYGASTDFGTVDLDELNQAVKDDKVYSSRAKTRSMSKFKFKFDTGTEIIDLG